ncbi:MAG: IS1634 family transposase, partial [Verrucomicrobiaceae bacterium]
MFLKTHRRFKNGKPHAYYSIAENKRTARGVVQRRVLYLGEINDNQREAWARAIRVFDEQAGEERELSLFSASTPVPDHAEGHGVRVRLDAMELHRPRQRGACWLATELWNQLRLDDFWRPLPGSSREGTDWTKVLQILTIYRLIDPGSEWRLHRDWFGGTALADLLDCDFSLAAKDTLYRCHDLLLFHKDALFTHLHNRWRDLFNPDCEVLLYDLTSTYFESTPDFPEDDKRRFGYSRDKRSDCVQIVIALVLTTEGFPLAYQVLPGNTVDNQTLKDFLAGIEKQYGKARRLWLMDRGIPTEEVLAEMRSSDPPAGYLVGTPKGRLSRYEERLLGQSWQSVRPGVRVKLIADEGETYVLARSDDRVHKERAMRRRRLRRYLKALLKLRLERRRPLSRDDLLKALGAAAKEAGNDSKHVMVTIPAEGQPVSPDTFHYRLDRPRLRQARRREGRYLLRTNLNGADPGEIWERYLQLVQVGEAFRNLKGDLGIRPIYHQLEKRIEAHVLISFLAFALHTTLRARLRELAPGLTPRAILEKMATLQMLDVLFPTTDGRTLTLPRHTQPGQEVQLLLNQLHLTLP